MRMGALANRYATALFTAAAEHGCAAEVGNQLQQLLQEMAEDGIFRQFMLNRSIPSARKKQIAAEALAEVLHPYVLNFLFLLFDKDREDILPEIGTAYLQVQQDAEHILAATLVTAAPVTEQTVTDIAASLSQLYQGKKIVFTQEIDPSLLGGAVIQIGNTMIDGSLKHKLAALREALVR